MRLNSQAIPMFVQQLLQANNMEYVHCWYGVRGIHLWHMFTQQYAINTESVSSWRHHVKETKSGVMVG